MKDFLKDLFTWKGRWPRYKFWLFPLVVVIPTIIAVLVTISFISYQGYMDDVNKTELTAQKNQLERLIAVKEVEGMSQENIMKDYEVIMLQDAIKDTEAYIERTNPDALDSEGTIAPPSEDTWIFILIFPFIILFYYINYVAYMKRFHDLGHSGWMALLSFVPIVSIGILIWTGFFKGEEGENKYGPNPLQPNKTKAPDNSEKITGETLTEIPNEL